MRRTRVRILAVLVGSALFALLSVAPTAAKPLDRGTFHEEFSGTIEDFCDVEGLTVEFEGVFDVRFTAKSHGRDGLVYFADHQSFTQTFTNPENDLSVTERTGAVSKDLHVVDNADGTLTIVFLITGPSSLYGPDGKAIARNPGQVRFEVVVDHSGTPTDPSDDTEISFTQIKDSTGRTDDFCEAAVAALIGA